MVIVDGWRSLYPNESDEYSYHIIRFYGTEYYKCSVRFNPFLHDPHLIEAWSFIGFVVTSLMATGVEFFTTQRYVSQWL